MLLSSYFVFVLLVFILGFLLSAFCLLTLRKLGVALPIFRSTLHRRLDIEQLSLISLNTHKDTYISHHSCLQLCFVAATRKALQIKFVARLIGVCCARLHICTSTGTCVSNLLLSVCAFWYIRMFVIIPMNTCVVVCFLSFSS